MKKLTWIGIVSLMLAATGAATGCTAEAPPETDDDVEGCMSDAECNGDRICDGGMCIAADPPPNGGQGGSAPDPNGPSTGAGTGSGGSNSGPAELLVENTTSMSVWYLYVARCSASSWGPDQLQENIIPAGSNFRITAISPDCYNIRAEAQNGTYWESYGEYFPAGQTYTWTLLP